MIANHWLISFVAPEMQERRDGAIVIVSSIGGLKGNAIIGAYNVSKAADFSLARNLAVEFGPYNVRINCIAPGLIKTDFAKALWDNPETLKEVNARTPLGRIGDPDEIAGAGCMRVGMGRWVRVRRGSAPFPASGVQIGDRPRRYRLTRLKRVPGMGQEFFGPPACDHAANMAAHQFDRTAFPGFDAALAIPAGQTCVKKAQTFSGVAGKSRSNTTADSSITCPRSSRILLQACSRASSRGFQKARILATQSDNSARPSDRVQYAFCASARTFTSLAALSAFRCWEMAGGESSNRPAISPAHKAPAASISTMR